MTEEDFGMFFDIGDEGYASILEERLETLQKKLEITTKALKEYAELETIGEEAREALKEMEEV